MKKFKVLSIFLSMLLIVCGFSLRSYADDNNKEELLLLCDEYGLKDIDIEDLPEGVVPLEVNSVEELNDIMKKREDEKKNIQVDTGFADDLLGLNNLYRDVAGLEIDFRYLPLGTRIHLSATYEFYSQGSFTGIERVINHGWNMKGFSPDVSLSNSRSSASASRGILTVDGTTDVDYYFLIEGLIKYNTEILDAGFQFDLHRGYYNTYADFR
ncbi:hypothetical protein CIW83_21625 [Tissierella sp. P1]|uniref:hypothetical protein n=1 Tax=Tissierella sp. P1 TaxID=1280483 RepID=UPI000BA10487|nr:hypothetical protein [Tissierella sp. P1]OZV10197.1 hypothetical protein CIW83_21625 [Tissierella sp. P1]